MRFVSIKKRPAVKGRKPKKAVSNPKKKGSIMAKKKRKNPKKVYRKLKNPVSVKKVHHRKRKNPFLKSVKKYHKRRHNPAKLSIKGILPILKEIALTTFALIVITKVIAKIPIKDAFKSFSKIGIGAALMLFVKHPIAKLGGLTLAVLGTKDALAAQWPEYFAGEDEYLIAGEDDFNGDELIGTNNLVSGANLMGTNNLLRGGYASNYDESNSSDMPY